MNLAIMILSDMFLITSGIFLANKNIPLFFVLSVLSYVIRIMFIGKDVEVE